MPDDAYEKAGVRVVTHGADLVKDADVVLKVQAPMPSEVELLRQGSFLISFLQPPTRGEILQALALRGGTAFSLELLPRISRAQSMDALSSHASAVCFIAVLISPTRPRLI